MYKYAITVQFAAGKKFTDVKQQITEAMEYYNSKSLLAKNYKKILELNYSPDEFTMSIILESKNELPMPSKALRLFSTYLVYENPLPSSYFLGKQLFKTTSRPLDANPVPVPAPSDERAAVSLQSNVYNAANTPAASKLRRLRTMLQEAEAIIDDLIKDIENTEYENDEEDE